MANNTTEINNTSLDLFEIEKLILRLKLIINNNTPENNIDRKVAT